MAFYRMPGTDDIQVIAQKQQKVTKVELTSKLSTKKGFLFAPFKQDKTFSSLLILPDIFTTAVKLPALNFAENKSEHSEYKKVKLKQASKKQYVAYVKNIKQHIKKGDFKKVVAARVIKNTKGPKFNGLSFFKNLCKKYPTAFVSLVYTPEYGLWIGATPEILLSVQGKNFKTYSLAGTKANTTKNADVAWGAKELDEQKIVSGYIQSAFKKVTKTAPVIKGPETIEAGNLLHLRTTFTYRNIPASKWPQMVAKLHPTPAVSGLPKQQSIAFIQNNEITARGFYSGYLGPVNLQKEINLFVNLRCMQVLKNKLAVHVGCGITSKSNHEDEWKESEMKAETLLSVLNLKKP